MKIAITGGIGSGKSTIGEIFRSLGYPVFSCDEIYSDIINSNDYIIAVKNAFGEAVLTDDKVDRKKLSAVVFKDEERLKKLNAVSHPLIMKELSNLMEKCDVAFAEVPLLFEGGFENIFDKVIVLRRDISVRVESVIQRDGISEDEVKKKIKNQFDYESLSDNGYTIIYNDGDRLTLREEAVKFLNELKK